MASSGSFNTSAYSASDGTRFLTFSWTETSQSVASNTTTISWTLKGGGTSKQYIYAGNFKVVIAGETVYSSGERIKLYNGTSVASGTYVFTHNADGTKSFSASAEGAIYYYAVNCSGSQTFTLDTIARASQPSCITYPNHTQNVGYFGDTISIHMNRNASAFTHTVRYAFGSLSGTCINADTGKAATGIGTGFKWKIPEAFMDLLPEDLSGSGTIYVDTYNGSTFIGTKSCGFTASVPASVKPSCTIQVLDDTGTKDKYGSLVKGLSKLYVKTNFYAAYSSPVKAYNVTANGTKYTKAEITTDVLTAAGTTTVTATVTDKRERTSAAATASFPVLDYSAPKITALAVHRCDKDGTANDRGEYVEILFSGSVVSLNSKNSATYSIKYKKSGITSWTTLTTDANGKNLSSLTGKYSVSNESFIFAADGNSSYDVEVTVQDNHKSGSRATSASTAFTLVNYHPEGNGISFGGVSKNQNRFENNLDLQQLGNSFVSNSSGIGGTAGFVRMALITITGMYANAPIVFEFTQRGRNTPMVVNVLFQSKANAKPPLQAIWYEGSNYDAYLSETSDSEWGLYVSKSEAHDDITLSRWYTSTYMQQRIKVSFPGDHVDSVPLGLNGYYRATPAIQRSIIDCLLPVGMIIQLYSHADPNTMYPGTTWVRMANTFLWGVDANGDIGTTGGEKTHILTANEIPSHNHGGTYTNAGTSTKTHAWLASGGSAMAYDTVNTGGGAAHNNMPPYTQISIWRRTA